MSADREFVEGETIGTYLGMPVVVDSSVPVDGFRILDSAGDVVAEGTFTGFVGRSTND